ncbi:hypothetical protein ACTS95_10290 [Empedobacter brevis]
MKKPFIFTVLACTGISLFASSCSDDESAAIANKEEVALSKEQRIIFNAKLDSTLVKMYSNNVELSEKMSLSLPQASFSDEGELKTANLSKEDILAAVNIVRHDMGITKSAKVVGPFESDAQWQIHQKNKKIMLVSEGGYPTTGVYFADVVVFRGWHYAPAEAVAGYADDEPVTEWGWGYKTDNGFTEANRGFILSSSRQAYNQLYMTTESFTIHVKNNILGQSMNYYKPFDGRQALLRYRFYYITL